MIISRVYKKAVRAVRYNSPVIIVDSEWVGEKSERYKEDISAGIVFKNTNIPYVPNMQMNTYMRELYIQKLCQSKTYTLNQPLVIKNPYNTPFSFYMHL